MRNRAEKARHQGCGALEKARFKPESFDAVTMWHVIEHVLDSYAVVKEARRVLKRRGVLVVGTPNFDSIQSTLFGKNWAHLDVPRHLHFFTSASLRKMLEENGFHVVRESTYSREHGAWGFARSLLNALGFGRGASELVSGRGAKSFSWRLPKALLMAFSEVFARAEAFFGRGAVINVVAVKR